MMEVCSFWRVCEFGNKSRVRNSMCTRMRATGHFTTRQKSEEKHDKTKSTQTHRGGTERIVGSERETAGGQQAGQHATQATG